MSTAKIIILIINLLGGAAVIGSYIFTLAGNAKGANAFWGGTPIGVKSVYTVSMLLSALSYFAFMYFIMFKLNLSSVNLGLLYTAFLGILVASAFWMPLTNAYLAQVGVGLWVAIRLVLAIVGISSILLAGLLINLSTGNSGISYWLAVAGSVYFAFHTAVLDMLLWPVFFRS
jgi:hypothetical protein